VGVALGVRVPIRVGVRAGVPFGVRIRSEYGDTRVGVLAPLLRSGVVVMATSRSSFLFIVSSCALGEMASLDLSPKPLDALPYRIICIV
jgi:hypothetical protein